MQFRGVRKRARARHVDIDFTKDLDAHAPEEWGREIDQSLFPGGYFKEFIFFHKTSRTLILADTIINIVAFARALRPNGLLVFTLEHAVGAEDGVNYRLQLHGRYSHAQAYVEQLLSSSGLQSKIICAELRMEAGVPVNGLVIGATKPASGHS